MAKKRKAGDKSSEQTQREESLSPPSESKEDDEDEDGEEVPSSSNQSSSESGSDLESEVEDSPLSSPSSQDLVDVDFEFFDPKPDDFHGTKALLQNYLDDSIWDINGFVELFLAQTTVGSVIKTSEEESPIGIITALNLARYQDCACMKEIRQYLQSKSSEMPEAKQLERFWTKKVKDVGLLVSERLINIPMEIVPPLYDGLFEEILWATEDEPTQELQNSFKFKHYLLLTKVFKELPTKSRTSGNNHLKKQVDNDEGSGDLIFIKQEDEIFLKLSSWSFTFPLKSEASATHETKSMSQLRLVMGLEVKQMSAFKALLKGLVETS